MAKKTSKNKGKKIKNNNKKNMSNIPNKTYKNPKTGKKYTVT